MPLTYVEKTDCRFTSGGKRMHFGGRQYNPVLSTPEVELAEKVAAEEEANGFAVVAIKRGRYVDVWGTTSRVEV